MDQIQRIEGMVAPSLEALGYDVVRVQLVGDKHRTLQVMAERRDGAAMTVEDCAAISREISVLLDVDDPIGSAYDLEVSSPGIDRPLVSLGDFERFSGFDARIELDRAIGGRRKYKGRLLGLDGEEIKLHLGAETVRLPFAEIRRAKLLLTDELLAAGRPPAT
jgi:ribosome maturation factor RimP